MGSTVSMLGSRMVGVTYPLLAFTLTESPAWIGGVMFASTVPGLLWYIPAGAITDRLGPRRVMVCSESARVLLMTVLCAEIALGTLEISHLVVIALLEGALSVSSSVAETALIPTTVEPGTVETALAMHETSVHGMVLAGRPLGGLLFGLKPIVPFVANALMFFSAAALLARLRPDDGGRGRRRVPLLRDMRAGLGELWHHRFLRSATLITAFTNLMVQGLIVVFLSEAAEQGLPSALAGVILAFSGVGGIIGAFISPQRQRISRRIEEKASRREWAASLVGWLGLAHRQRSMMLVHLWACAAALALPLALAQVSFSFALALLVVGLAGGLSNVTLRTVLSRVPADRVARVVGVSRLGSYSAVAIGPLLATLLVGRVESYVALLVLGTPMFLLALAMTMVGRFRSSLTSAPDPQREPVS